MGDQPKWPGRKDWSAINPDVVEAYVRRACQNAQSGQLDADDIETLDALPELIRALLERRRQPRAPRP